MAQKRMIDKKISVSEQVSNLDVLGQLLFTWMIPHADDLGLLPYSPKTIKALVIPMLNITLEDVITQIKSIKDQRLIVTFEYKGEKFLRIVNFLNTQTFKKDRNPSTMLKIEFSKEAPQSWDLCEKLILEDSGFQLEDSGFQLDTEVNLIKYNITNSINDILVQKAPAIEIPPKRKCTNPKGHSDCIESIDNIQAAFKKQFPNYGKQVKAYHQILKAGFTPTQVGSCLNAMDEDKFWSSNGWDLMDAANQLGKGGGKYVKL